MFDNIAFNVVIGLVFIYLLYSLLVTIIGEMLASWFGLRQRMLRTAIERMLNDENYQNIKKAKKSAGENKKNILFKRKIDLKKQGKWSRFMLQQTNMFGKSFAGKFYEYPSIKYLSKGQTEQKGGFNQTKPSYISAQNFAETLINMFSEKGVGNSKLEQVKFCLQFNTCHIDPETLKQFRNLFANAGDDINAFGTKLMQWYNETMDRTNGWYKRRLKLILFWLGFLIAVAFNVDSIRIAKLLANDKDARSQLVNMGVALAKDSLKYKDFVYSNGDSIHSKAVIDTGYSHITKDIKTANLILGLGWNFANLRCKDDYTVEKDPTDAKKNAIFNQILKYQDSLTSNENKEKDKKKIINQRSDSISKLIDNKNLLALDTLYKADQINYSKPEKKQPLIDSLKSKQNSLIEYERQIKLGIISNKQDSIAHAIFHSNTALFKHYIDSLINDYFVAINSVGTINKGNTIVVKGSREYNNSEKIGYFFNVLFLQFGWMGFVLTGLALSLGAPFWFGVLNKLVSLRSSGVKPEDKESKNPTDLNTPQLEYASLLQQQTIIEPEADSLDIAVQGLKNKYNSYPGILSIERGFSKESGQKEQAIEIHAIPQTIDYLKKKLGFNYNGFVLSYIPNTIIKAQLKGGDTIMNEALEDIRGTLGCFANRIDNDKKYLISCWHVLERLNDPVEDKNGNIVATVIDGSITDKLDIGFAELKSATGINNDNLGIRFNWRQLTDADAINESHVQFLGATDASPKKAVIYNNALDSKIIHNDETGLSYTLADLFSITQYDPSGSPIAPSFDGDSGSVIIDSLGYPLGIVVGGDASFTYAVKFSNALDKDSLYKNYYLPI